MAIESGLFSQYDPVPPDPSEAPYYLDVVELEALHRRMVQIDVPTVESIVGSRIEGSPQRLVTSLLKEPMASNLTEAHIASGRISRGGGGLFHQLGLIYGTVALNDHNWRLTGSRLQADDPDQYQLALQLTASASYSMHFDAYRAIAQQRGIALPPWWTERFRELENTAADGFTILSALILPHAERLAGGLVGGDAPEDALAALHTGMVDAKIFMQNYGLPRLGRSAAPMYRFTSPALYPVSFGDEPFSLSRDDTVHTAMEKIRPNAAEVAWHDVIYFGMRTKALTEAQAVQVGPNAFQTRHRIIDAVPPDGFDEENRWPVKAVWLHRALPEMRRHGMVVRPCQDVSADEQALRDSEAQHSTPWRLISPLHGVIGD